MLTAVRLAQRTAPTLILRKLTGVYGSVFTDAVLLRSELMGREVAVGYEADLSKDGIIDIFDMLEMRERLITQS